MPEFETLFAVAFAGLALSATPGPSMLYVLSRSSAQSRSAGYASALGLGLGGIVLAIATAFGLAALFQKFEWLMVGLRFVGSIYLIYLGYGLIRDAYVPLDLSFTDTPTIRQPFWEIVWQGMWVELLNPKTVLFFALFLPPFVDPSLGDGSLKGQLIILGILVPLTAIPSDITVAWLGAKLTQTVSQSPAIRKVMAWIGGSALGLIAINLHLGVF